MPFHVLENVDRRWMVYFNKLDQAHKDVHFLPAYLNIYKDVYGATPYIAIYEDGDDFVMQPFIQRRVNDLPFLKDRDDSALYYDIANAYGYGGPLAKNDQSSRLYDAFVKKFHDYCDVQGLASEFCSLHPILNDVQAKKLDSVLPLQNQKKVCVIDLKGEEEDLIARFSQGHRRNWRKAMKNDITVRKVSPTTENLRIFNDIYYHTMDRQNAAERWFFPENYFSMCCRHLGEDHSSLFFAYYQNKPISGYFLIHGFNTAYYHFGGGYSDYFDMRPNNLLMVETMIWAKRQGYELYHLGGGVSADENDPLARFKRGFGAFEAQLFTYGKVHNQGKYDILVKLALEGKKLEQPDFFPLYRR